MTRQQLTRDIVIAFLETNDLPAADVAGLISGVCGALAAIERGETPARPSEPVSAYRITRSVTADGITSFLDGKSYKALKRHLRAQGYTPEAYRAHFGLPADYPMVAANYSAVRRFHAKRLGLGARNEDGSRTPLTPAT